MILGKEQFKEHTDNPYIHQKLVPKLYANWFFINQTNFDKYHIKGLFDSTFYWLSFVKFSFNR